MAFQFEPILDSVNPQPVVKQDGRFFSGAPNIYIQDAAADPQNNPDANGYYYGLVSSVTYPVYELGCVVDVSMNENLSLTDVMCDRVGVVDTIVRKQFVEFQFTLKSLLPLDILAKIFGLPAPTTSTGQSITGLSDVADRYFHVYAPRVFNSDTGDFFFIYLHRAKLVSPLNISMPFSDAWSVPVTVRAFADTTKPDNQRFGVISVIDSTIP